jgi:hypothetical protein
MTRIKSQFCIQTEIKPQLLTAAADGTLQDYVPARSLILSYNILLFIAFSSEIGLAVTLMLLGQGNYIFVLGSLMLALGGLLLGYGVGGLLRNSWFRALPPALAAPIHTGAGLEYLEIAAGTLAVIGISYLRSLDEVGVAVIFVVAVPTLLALLITLFESLSFLASTKHKFLRKQMADAQRWFASLTHADELKGYRAIYAAKVAEIGLRMRRAIARECCEAVWLMVLRSS